MLLNVKLDDSDHVGELQLHLQSVIDIKCVDALNTLRDTNSHRLLLSPAVSRFVKLV